jgi:hypothetical protein
VPSGIDLFTPAPFVRKSETSAAAAESIGAVAGTIRAAVYRELQDRGKAGATDDELQTALGLRVQTETARRCELVDLGLVSDSGQTRKTSAGRLAVVWVAAPDRFGAGRKLSSGGFRETARRKAVRMALLESVIADAQRWLESAGAERTGGPDLAALFEILARGGGK